MTTEQFCYWLQGYFEVSVFDKPLNENQTQIIREHLQEVFKKVTPTRTLAPRVLDESERKAFTEIMSKIQTKNPADQSYCSANIHDLPKYSQTQAVIVPPQHAGSC